MLERKERLLPPLPLKETVKANGYHIKFRDALPVPQLLSDLHVQQGKRPRPGCSTAAEVRKTWLEP